MLTLCFEKMAQSFQGELFITLRQTKHAAHLRTSVE